MATSVRHRSSALTPVKVNHCVLGGLKCLQLYRTLPGYRVTCQQRQLLVATSTKATVQPVVQVGHAGDASPAPSPAPAPDTSSPFLWERNWVPVTPISHLDPGRPTPITLLGQALVVWHHATRGWVVMRDACPHRLAPLSEGRLEAGGTRLACAYHGWEFSETGDCARVPQLSNDDRASATACASPRSCVATFPTLVKDGLLFAWLDESGEGRDAARQAPEPQLLDEGATPFMQWAIMEVPNDYTFWIEQAMDPSHANFLHHGLGGFKDSNFVPMEAEVVENVDAVRGYTWRHGAYEMKQAGMKAVREFSPPFINRFRYDMPNGTATYFCAIFVPVRPGVCRTMFSFGTGPSLAHQQQQQLGSDGAAADSSSSSSSSKGDSAAAGKGILPAVLGLLRKLPHWLYLDVLLGDMDVLMMCRQEQLMRRNGLTFRDYVLNSPADAGVAAVNTWLSKAGYPSSLWGDRPASAFPGRTYAGWPDQDLPLERLLSRQERHVRHCVVCQKGMALVTKLCVGLTAAAALAGAVAAGLAVLAVVSPQGAAAVGGWGRVVGLAAVAGALAVMAARGWDFREDRFISGVKQWRRRGGFPGFKRAA